MNGGRLLGYGVVISLLLHAMLLPFVHTRAANAFEARIPGGLIVRLPPPPPTPDPSPTPAPRRHATPQHTVPPLHGRTPSRSDVRRALRHRTAVLIAHLDARGVAPVNGDVVATGDGAGPPSGDHADTPGNAPDAAATAPAATPVPTPTPRSCAHPDVPAATLRTVEPETPPAALAQGVSGTVVVVVSLDANSRVIDARVRTSPSPLLNASALAAARGSTFRTETHDCAPVAADYLFTVDFSAT